MPILNYTTDISAHRTLSEIQQQLASKGANKVMIEYNQDPAAQRGQPIALMFQIQVGNGEDYHYRLPCRHQGVLKALRNDKDVGRRYKTEQHALNVAWRIIKDWVEVQLALVQSQQSTMDEVFFAYLLQESGATIYQTFTQSRHLIEKQS